MIPREDARPEIMSWIIGELRDYADKQKWNRGDVQHTTWDEGNAQWWDDFVMQYLHRAKILGHTEDLGRQALLKALVTLFEMCVTMYIGTEHLPLPGYPSGEIHWGGEDEGRAV